MRERTLCFLAYSLVAVKPLSIYGFTDIVLHPSIYYQLGHFVSDTCLNEDRAPSPRGGNSLGLESVVGAAVVQVVADAAHDQRQNLHFS